MRRLMNGLALAVFVLTASFLSTAEADDWCIPKCEDGRCTICPDLLSVESEPDSTMVLMGKPDATEWGVGAGIPYRLLTLEGKVLGGNSGSWLETTLERVGTSPRREVTRLLSVRITKGTRDSEAAYGVSVPQPPGRSGYRITVQNGGKTVWTGRQRMAGTVAIVDEWPGLTSAGLDRRGIPVGGWGFAPARAIRIPHAGGRSDKTVRGDRIQVSLDGGTRGDGPLILRLHASSGVESIRIPSVREGLFNVPIAASK
jgi:hypothetical protein